MNKTENISLVSEYKGNQISIYLTFPNMSTKKVKVNSSFPISVIFSILPNGNKIIFYQGEIIQSSSSFDKYRITDNDRIVIIPTQQVSFETEQFWIKATKHDIEVKSEISSLNDSKMKFVKYLQNDRVFFIMENNSRSYQRIIQNMKILSNKSNHADHNTTINWNKSEFPNETSLPNIWE
jgi:hypothetical protein